MNEITRRKISYALRALRNQRKTDKHKEAIAEAMRAKWQERKNNIIKDLQQ